MTQDCCHLAQVLERDIVELKAALRDAGNDRLYKSLKLQKKPLRELVEGEAQDI